MSKAVDLARLGSFISVTANSATTSENTIGIYSVTSQKIIVTDGRSGNGAFDGGNTAYPAIELLSSGMNSSTAKYTPSIKFGSTDAQFITQNPKFGAAIVAEATQNYTTDTTGGMALSFWTSPNSPGVETSLRERMTIEASGQVTVNNSGFLAWTNSQLLFTTTGQGQGARIGKFSDDNLYIENFDDADIIFRTQASPAGEVVKMHGANGNVSVFNSLTVDNDLLFNSGFGSAAKAYGCRAWVNFDSSLVTNPGSMTGVRGNGNVSSVTDNGVGDYTVNFINPFPDGNYAFAGTAGSGSITAGTARVISQNITAPTPSSFRITIKLASDGVSNSDSMTYVALVFFR